MRKLVLIMILAMIPIVNALEIPVRTVPNITIATWQHTDNLTNATNFWVNITIRTEHAKYEFLSLGPNESKYQDMEILLIRNVSFSENPEVNFYQQCVDKLLNLSTPEIQNKLIQCEAGKQFLADINSELKENYTAMVMNCTSSSTYQQLLDTEKNEKANCQTELTNIQSTSKNNGIYFGIFGFAGVGIGYYIFVKRRNARGTVERQLGQPIYSEMDKQHLNDAEKLRMQLERLKSEKNTRVS